MAEGEGDSWKMSNESTAEYVFAHLCDKSAEDRAAILARVQELLKAHDEAPKDFLEPKQRTW